ncbi:target of rapamycin complex subunit lst8 [Sipha flava]|uniref:Target of rapamycin complex subunit lst8 n=2 Tax=Sipha flava TaxID=143950 RepID=A0A8B8FF91_9HEMI|nr:target of rapamycin complex subunit lst8 [Sipha flava]
MVDSALTEKVLLATGGYDHTIKLWHANTGVCNRSLTHLDSQVNALEITPDRQLLAAAGFQHIRMYDLNSSNPNPILNYEGISKNITGVGFHEDGKWMFTCGEDYCARVWDLRSRNLQCQRIFETNAPITSICLHPNQGELILGDQSGLLHLWDLKTDHNEQLIPEVDASIQCVAIDSSANYVASVNNKGNCYLWKLNGNGTRLSPKHKMIAHRKYALHCKFSPDSSLLVTSSADQTACIWKTSDFSLKQELKDEHQRWVWDTAFSNDSEHLLTASSDGMARLWNIETGNIEREYEGHQKALTALAFCDSFS